MLQKWESFDVKEKGFGVFIRYEASYSLPK